MFLPAKNAASRVATLVLVLSAFSWSQQYSKADREFVQEMLHNVATDVEKHYYDPKLHGVDWDAKVRDAQQHIDSANSMDSAVSEIAGLLDSLNDSHTVFSPPPRTYNHDYGFSLEMFGDRCFVTRVVPNSDAEKKGLVVGDQVVDIAGIRVSRRTLWRILYIVNELRPQPGLQLTLVRGNDKRQLQVMAKLTLSPKINYFQAQGINSYRRDLADTIHARRPRYFSRGDALLVLRFPSFSFSDEEVDNIVGRMRKHQAVIVDLRGNGGGLEETLLRLLGGLFQNDVKVCDRVQRKSTTAVSVKGRHHDAFIGKLFVLIDSESGSAAELFARVVQLERRGFVIGDRSAGMVMESLYYSHPIGLQSPLTYGTLITDANLIMTDGKSLEHVGVEPDIAILPTSEDLANKRDPVLVKAAALAGVQLTSEEAGKLFEGD